MKSICSIFLLSLLLAAPAFTDEVKPRLALCVSGDEKAETIVALMEVELSKRDDVILLDRAHVNKVLAEHNLSLMGLLSTDDALQAGQLLQCDIFAELYHGKATEDLSEVASIVAFDGITGVRLCDETLPGVSELEKIAKVAGEKLLAGCRKWRGGDAETPCRTIALLNVRNVDLPVEMNGIANCIGPLLERQLLRSPEIVVLERKRLDHINREADLTGDRRDRLLASTVLLELDLSRGRKKGNVKIRGSINNVAGKEIGVVFAEGDTDNLQQVVFGLAQKTVKTLQQEPLKQSDVKVRVNESNRFAAEYKRLIDRHRLKEALAAIEAAVALVPKELHKQELLCAALESLANVRREEKLYTEMFNMIERDLAIREKWDASKHIPYLFGGMELSLRLAIMSRGEFDRESAEHLLQLRRCYRHFWTKYAFSRGADFWSENPYKAPWHFIDLWAESPEQWLEAILSVSKEGMPFVLSWEETSYVRPNPYVKSKEDRPVLLTAPEYLEGIYAIQDLSQDGKHKLMESYERWAQDGNMEAHLCAAMLAQLFSNQFSNADITVKRHLHDAGTLAIQTGPDLVWWFATSLCWDPHRMFPKDVVIYELRRLAENMEKKKIVIPDLLSILDEWDTASVGHPGTYLEKAYALLKNPHYKTYTAYQLPREEIIKIVNDWYRRRHGLGLPGYEKQDEPEQPCPWKSTVKLFEAPNDAKIVSSELNKDFMYLLVVWIPSGLHHIYEYPAYWDDEKFIREYVQDFKETEKKVIYELHRVDIINGTSQRIGTLKRNLRFYGMISVGKHAVYAPTTQGLIVFPSDGSPSWTLSQEHRLPKCRVDAAIEVGSSIYLGCCRYQTYRTSGAIHFDEREEGYLLRCNLDENDMEVISSSARREKKSPLDNCAPYSIYGFFLDKPRQRLAFIVDGEYGNRNNGLWILDLRTGKMSKLFRAYASWPWPPHPISDKQVILAGRSAPFHIWNLKSDRLAKFLTYKKASHVEAMIILKNDIYIVDSLVHKKWRICQRDKGKQNVPLPPLDEEVPFILRTWQNKLIACTPHALWLLEPEPRKATKLDSGTKINSSDSTEQEE